MGVFQLLHPRSREPASHSANHWTSAGFASWFPYVLFFTLFANIPFWVASRWLAISQDGWFCLDYVVAGLLALFAPRIVAPVLFLLAVAVDLIGAISETYYLPISQIFTNLGAVRQLSVSRLFAGVIVLLLTLFAALMSALPPIATVPKKYRARVATCLLAFAVLCLSIDAIEMLRNPGNRLGQLQSWHEIRGEIRAGHFPKLSLSRVPAFRLALRKFFPAPSGLPIRNAAALALQSAKRLAAENNGELPNLVIILVESWGLDTDSTVSRALVQPYAQSGLPARYDIVQGTVPFLGPTLSGEGRELCGSTIGFHLTESSAQEVQGCLPNRLAAMGYHGVAIHGMTGAMFDRIKWYKTLGFQEMWFTPQFLEAKLSTCNGAFWGICDAAIAEWMGHRLEKRSANPEFLYWVTLNSHLPVIVPSPITGGASCSFTQSLSEQPSLCSWYQLIANVHRSVADMAMTNLARPTVFVIVGDHAPPFSDPKLRNRFSQTTVPYVLLVPRWQAAK